MQSLKYNIIVYIFFNIIVYTRVIYHGSVWNKHKKPNAKKMKTRVI